MEHTVQHSQLFMNDSYMSLVISGYTTYTIQSSWTQYFRTIQFSVLCITRRQHIEGK